MKGNAGSENTKQYMYIYVYVCAGKPAIKIQGKSQEVCSPKNTKNTPQIVTEGREREQELKRSHRAQQRCHHRVGIKNEESTQEKETVKTDKPQRGREREAKERKRHQGSAMTDSPE